MKGVLPLAVLGFLFTCSLAEAQDAPDVAAVPEIEAARGPYLRNLATIQRARDARIAPLLKSYTANLEALQREITASGKLEAALLVKAEHERASAGEAPSVEQRRTMPPQLVALRTRFEKDREPIDTASRKQEEQQTRTYLSALDALQRRFTTQNQLEKALAVKAERDRLASPSSEAAAAMAVVAPTATAGRDAQLDVAIAEKIQEVVRSRSYVKTEASQETGRGGEDIPDQGALLVGFEFTEGATDRLPDIRSLRPYFLTSEGIVAGKDRGELPEVTEKTMARNGYAVGGLVIAAGKRRIQGIQVIFMKIDPRTGRLDTTPNSSYKSKWIGSRPRPPLKQLAGDGRLVIGVYGRTGADADTLGLVHMP
jgi:hypothetical protein